ncbi:IS5/IS1182 family transposase [Lysinibacillus fusiformis]|uniref:transposase n=1 Tax=Lysinibacillus fusiformis TaxID=28031 RepID=UPI000BBA45F3|nr:transposase [Lysinibacillus fusiformis]PCD84455.1 IS5/IS1182 family transposase [Lysinibacillus fusiformis]
MMTKNQTNEREQLEMLTIDQLVPNDHLVRKLEAAIDFSFIYPLVEHLYSPNGRPSIDPVVLVKMTFIQYVFGIRSMRQTIKEIETNMAYRWFLGFGFHTEVPHFSTFGKNYVRRFQDTDIFEQIFYRILKEIMHQGLLHADHLFIDSTHVKASANKRKYDKKVVRKETRAYEEKLQLELNIDREEHGKKPYTRPKTKDGFFRKHEYTYDEHYNCYLCPQGQILKYATTTKEGYRQYKSNPLICAKCPSLSQCTESKHHQKLIQRHIWESYVEEAEHLRHSYDIKQIYAKRKETIERVFADAKEKHGMRWTTLRGLKKLSMQAMLTFAAMNLKKLATWTWQVA